jgi:hypothetical protein
MRPAAFRDLLVDLLKNTPAVQKVNTLDNGPYPYALAATVAGREHRWQVIGQLAEGAKHDTPTAPVHGQPASFTTAAVTEKPDAWLGGVIGAAESPDTRQIDVWSAREGRDSVGLTVFFHNGERAFVRLV